MFFDEEKANNYAAHRFVKHPKPDASCDLKCRQEMYCQTVSNDYDEYQFCRGKSLFDLFSYQGLLSVEHFIDSHWYSPK